MASVNDSPLDSKQSRRVTTGMEPLLYDKIEYTYPDDVTTVMTYSFLSDLAGVTQLAAIIVCVYTDPTKTVLVSKTRMA